MKWLDRIAVVALSIAILAMTMIVSDYAENKKIINDARSKFHSEETFAESDPKDVKNSNRMDGENLSTEKIEKTEESGSVSNKASSNEVQGDKTDQMSSLNPDYAGWLSIRGTDVDYPVVKGKDNKFYLDHGFDMKPNVSGAIFMDYRNKNDGTDKNIVIYGHNMKNGTMFKGLMDFKRKEFLEGNRLIYFYDGREESIWEIFSVYVADTGFNYIRTEFTEIQFDSFVRQVYEKSMYSVEEEMEKIDAVLTLSTCSYEFDDARFVVHAREIKEEES